MNITEDLHYAGTLDETVAVLLSQELAFRRIQETGGTDYAFAEDTVDGKKTVTIDLTPGPKQIPEQFAKFIGSKASAHIVVTETRSSAGAQIDYAVTTSLPAQIAARMLLVDSGTTTAGRLEISIKVTVPFVGSMVERKIAAEVPGVVEKDTKLVNELILEHRSHNA